MSKKKVTKVCKLQFQAGGAKPGPALASAGINMPQFCTASMMQQKIVKVILFQLSLLLMKIRVLISY